MSWLFKRPKDQAEKIRKDIKRLSKPVFSIEHEGHDYQFYELSNIHDMPAKRYMIMNQFIENARRGLTRDELEEYLNELTNYIDPKKNGGEIDIVKANMLTNYMLTCTRIEMDIDLTMRVISCCLLMDGEDPLDYDNDINEFKIGLFEKYGVTAFFLSEPIKKYLNLIGTSKIDMEEILNRRKLRQVATKELNEIGISVWTTYKNTKD